MMRKILMALLGASFLIPMEADAQRGRQRNQPVDRYVAPTNSARLARCRAPGQGRSYVCTNDRRDDVVYRYSGNIGPRARRAWITPQWRRTSIYLTPRDFRRDELGQGRLRAILGKATLRRVRDHGRRAGLNGSVRGHWVGSRRAGSTLVLTMTADMPYEAAVFGLVDDFLLRNFRRARYQSW